MKTKPDPAQEAFRSAFDHIVGTVETPRWTELSTVTERKVQKKETERVWWHQPAVVAGSAALVTLAAAVPLFLLTGSGEEEAADPDVIVAPPITVARSLLEEVQEITRSDDFLWAWDGDGHLAGRWLGDWNAFPSLPDPVVDVALYEGTVWAITTNRCDPSVADYESLECETTLWRLDGQIWEPFPALSGLQLPDNLEDIEFDSAGTMWLIASDGALYTWNGDEATTVADAGFNNDGISITADGTVWTSRFNPYFPDDIGLARFDDQIGAFQPGNPGDSGNHHAVMTTTEDGDLWVWFSRYPATGSLSGQALAYYDSKAGEWTIHELNFPGGTVRAMTALNESVWLATMSEGLWEFDGQTWTRIHDASGSELLDVAAGRDGTVWYVEDNTLKEVQP